ncbi:MAG: YceI family protein [Ornithinibacter sp.]
MTTAPTLTTLPTGTWEVDPTHTEVGFVARHLMVSKVRGTFGEVTGAVEVADPLERSTATANVRMGSVDTGSPDRDTHLRSADFFDVEAFPAMTFTSTAFTGDTLTGDLTIRDVTREVTFDVEFGGVATDPWGGTRAGFEATGSVSRRDFGLEWNVALESGGVLVGDRVTITLDVQLVRSA